MTKVASDDVWLSVIGRSLAYLCLEQATKLEPKKFDTVNKKVDFLKDMGLPKDDAAYVAGQYARISRRAIATAASQEGSGPCQKRQKVKPLTRWKSSRA